MMIASHQLKNAGYRVTTFHSSLPELIPWFPRHDLSALPSEEELIKQLDGYDLIIIQNDNSNKVAKILKAHRHKTSMFYPSYKASKHAPLTAHDHVFDENLCMAENIAFKIQSPSKDNGLTPPSHLTHRLNEKQILIHPTSRVASKNWRAEGFVKVAKELALQGYNPLFCVSPQEMQEWSFLEREGLTLAHCQNLSALASLVYESGYAIGNDSMLGHLSSNLAIPSLIIANDEKRMRLWRPGWLPAKIVTPSPYLPNWKFLRLKETKWQHFISKKRVLNAFDELRGSF